MSKVPVFQSNVGFTPMHHSFHASQFDGMSYLGTTDQFGNTRPSWYEPYSARYVLYMQA